MKKTGRNPSVSLLILITVVLGMSFVLIGCGFFDDNSQPEVERITNQTLYVGGKTTVEVNVTDAEVDDTHTISASSDDTSIATVSVKDTTPYYHGYSSRDDNDHSLCYR